MNNLRAWIAILITAGGLACSPEPSQRPREQSPATRRPAAVVVKTTGAVPAAVAASQRVAEEWMTLWEGLATTAEATPGNCEAIGAAWSRQLSGRVDEVRALIAASAAEPDALRRRNASRYKERMDRLVPRMTAIRAGCDGNRAIEASMALLEPATVHGAHGAHGGHDHAH